MNDLDKDLLQTSQLLSLESGKQADDAWRRALEWFKKNGVA